MSKKTMAAGLAGLMLGGCGASPDSSDPRATPTVSQLLNAANAEYIIGGRPSDMSDFEVDGRAVNYTDELDGTSAQVFVTPQHQIIIAYQGTTGGTNALINPPIVVTQILTDIQGFAGDGTPEAFDSALAFAKTVVSEAQQQGYAADDIFVTGHSLGGWEAEYISLQIGLAGIGFEAPCLYTTVPGNGADSNFVITATYGDPVPSFASDIQGEQPLAPTYAAGGGQCPHYGGIVMLGDSANQEQLTKGVANWGNGNPVDQALVIADFAALMAKYHGPGVQAYQLGVSLNPSGVVDALGDKQGPVFEAANDMIPQFIQAAASAGILTSP
jgi:hypothetical protein